MYAEALHTRTFQVIEREKREQEELMIDAKFHEDTLVQVRRGDAKEKEKERLAQEAMDKIKVFRHEQLTDNRRIKESIKKAEYEEGQKMKRDAKVRHKRTSGN